MHNFVGEKGESQVYFVKASKLETQHDIHKILLTHYWNTTKQVEDPTWSAQNVKKDFGFAVNFVKSSKSETQYDIHKIYHMLLKHHQVSQGPNMECTKRKRVLKNTNGELQNKWIIDVALHN